MKRIISLSLKYNDEKLINTILISCLKISYKKYIIYME